MSDAYVKTPDGNWRKEEIDPKKMELYSRRDEMLIQNLGKASDSDVTFAGRDELQGHPMFVYQHSLGSVAGLATSRTKTWVGVKDGLPYKIEMEAGITHDGKQFGVKTTTTYSDYNADLSIEPPM